MACVPQWGFVPGREVADALARAFGHCQAVQQLCKQQSTSINNRMDGIIRSKVAGGLAVALDISRAFDKVRHSEIMLALQAAEVPAELQALVGEWIQGAQYHGKDSGGTWTVDVCRGVRQGCVLSPLLYVLVVARLHSVLSDRFGPNMSEVMDYYADDTLFHSLFESEAELVTAIRQVEFLFECLAQAGLEVNDAKTQVLLQIRGTHAKQALKKYTETRKGSRFLRLSAFKQQRWLPICTQARYLGAQLAYDNYMDVTVQHRIVTARATYGRLRKVLTSRSTLSIRARIHLWKACVGAALFYALDSSGVTLSGLHKIRVLVQKHIRAISRQPAHVTHVGNQELLTKLGVPEPGAYIRERMLKLVEKWHYNAESPDCIPIKASQKILDWRQYNLSSLDQILQREGPEGRLVLRCPQCGLECANKTVLGSHMAKAHPQQTRPAFNRLLHSVGGRPRCSGCNDLFTSWDRLRKHIEHGACQFPVSEAGTRQQAGETSKDVQPDADKTGDASLPTALNSEVHNIIRQGGWRSLVQNVQWRKQLAQWCCLCGTWCASNRAVKMHLAKTHKAVWNLRKDRVERICRSQQADITVPCSLCGSISKDPKSHVVACPVIFQSVLIDFQQNGGSSGGGLLHASVASGQSITTGRPDGGCDELGCGEQKAPERPRASDRGRTARQRMAQDQARQGAGALRSAFAAGQSRCPETGRSNGQVGSASVGRESDASARLRLSLVRQQGGGQHPAGHVRDQRGMEACQRHHPGEGDPTAVLHHDGMHPEGTSCQNPTGGPGREPPESGQVVDVDQLREGLVVQEMGSTEQGPDQRGQDATDHDEVG